MAVTHVGSSALQIAAKPRALVVDDCRFIAERVARTLEARGYECTIALDGFRALEQLRDGSFDLLARDDSSQEVDASSLVPGRRENAQDDFCVRSGHRPNPGSGIFERHLSSQQ